MKYIISILSILSISCNEIIKIKEDPKEEYKSVYVKSINVLDKELITKDSTMKLDPVLTDSELALPISFNPLWKIDTICIKNDSMASFKFRQDYLYKERDDLVYSNLFYFFNSDTTICFSGQTESDVCLLNPDTSEIKFSVYYLHGINALFQGCLGQYSDIYDINSERCIEENKILGITTEYIHCEVVFKKLQ